MAYLSYPISSARRHWHFPLQYAPPHPKLGLTIIQLTNAVLIKLYCSNVPHQHVRQHVREARRKSIPSLSTPVPHLTWCCRGKLCLLSSVRIEKICRMVRVLETLNSCPLPVKTAWVQVTDILNPHSRVQFAQAGVCDWERMSQ